MMQCSSVTRESMANNVQQQTLGGPRFANRPPPPRSQVHRRPHEVALAELDPAVTQDVVGGRAVEIEVRQHVIEQQSLAGELALARAELERDLFVFGSVYLRRLKSLDVFDRVGKPALQLGESRIGIGQAKRLAARERAA